MFELGEKLTEVDVLSTEYQRLLGYPASCEIEGRALELIDWARNWYQVHGRPWLYARQVAIQPIDDESFSIEKEHFECRELARRFAEAQSTDAVILAVSAGPELEAYAQHAWIEEKPDEYFFLEMYGSAVVERLLTIASAKLCAWAYGASLSVLPHHSPGYEGWNIAEQTNLAQVIKCQDLDLPGPLQVLESGMLRPKKSLLAVFGLTQLNERKQALSELIPCERCSFHPCQFRRSPYRQAQDLEAAILIGGARNSESWQPPSPIQYKINKKALDRWANERLTITPAEDGTIDVVFKHEGTTCSNMGRPLMFDYFVRLSPESEGYRILKQECQPSDNDIGHQAMCGYLNSPHEMMETIYAEKPLLGEKLEKVLSWQRSSTTANCYCEKVSRHHMWGQVLETIHWALHRS